MSAVESVEDTRRTVMVRDIDLGFLEEEARKIPSLNLAMPIEELVKANEPHSRSKAQPRPLNVFFLFRKNWLESQRPRYKEAGENMAIQKVTPFIKEDWDNSSSRVKQFFQWAEKCHKDMHRERYPDYQFKRDGLGKKRGRPRTTAGPESVAGPRKRKTADSQLPEPAKRNRIVHDDVPDDVPEDYPGDDEDGDDNNDNDYGDDDEGAKTDPETWIATISNVITPQNGVYIDTPAYTNSYINTLSRETAMFGSVNGASIGISMISNAVHGNDDGNVAGMGDNDIDMALAQYALLQNVMKEIPFEPYDGSQLTNVWQAQSAFNQAEPPLIGDSSRWDPIGARSIVPLEDTYDDAIDVVPADEGTASSFMGTPSSCYSSFPPTPVDRGSDEQIARELFTDFPDFPLYPSPTIG